MRKYQNTLRTLLFFGVTWGQSASAQDPESLEEVVVTAYRSETKAAGIPFTTEVLTAEDLTERATRTLPTAFLDTPGVLVQQTTAAHGSPFIRGFTGRQNLLLQDGVRINNATWRSGPVQYWNTLDSLAVDRVELIKSQGSVLYGSDAIGGTVNTFSPESGFREQEKSGFFQRGQAVYRFDTNSQSHLGRMQQVIGVADKWGLTVGISGKDAGDIRVPGRAADGTKLGSLEGTGYEERAFDLKFEMALSDSLTLTAAASSLDQTDISRFHNTVNNRGWQRGSSQATPGSDRRRDYEQERLFSYLRLEDSEAGASWLDRWQLTFSYQDTSDLEDRVRSSGRRDQRFLEVKSYGLSVEAESSLPFGAVVWGADYYQDRADSSGLRNGTFRPSNSPVADGSSYETLGIFANLQMQPSDTTTFDFGARYTYAEANWDQYFPQGETMPRSGGDDWNDLSLAARGTWEANDSHTVFAALSQAFRAPNLDDLTGSQFSLNGLQTNGSPDLEPENYLTAELGVNYISPEQSARYTLSAYHTWIEDAVIQVERGGELFTSNGGDGYVYGVEAEVSWEVMDNWTLDSHVSWQSGRQDDATGERQYLRRLHPLQGGISLRYDDPAGVFWVQGRARAAAREDRLSPAAQNDTQRIPVNGTPSFVTFGLLGGYHVNERTFLTVALENLTDADYRIHGSGQNERGFNATFGVQVNW